MKWNQAEETFATTLPGYESRANQQRLAVRIQECLANSDILFAQAGTGTGKSFATLVAAIEEARRTGLPTVVATATKALQDQYINDCLFLQETLGAIEPFTFAVLKGRSNYACRAKLGELREGDVFGLSGLLEELASDEHTGDLDQVVTMIDPRDKSKLVSTSDECPGKKGCPFGQVCFAEAAKAKAKQADVIIVNHALLVTDLDLRTKLTDGEGNPIGMLPEYGAVMIDEGHELEEYATGTLGQEFSQRGIQRLATEVANFTDEPEHASKINGAAAGLFMALDALLAKQGKSARTTPLTDSDLLTLENGFVGILSALRSAWTAANGVSTRGDDYLSMKQKRIKKRIGALGDRFNAIVMTDSAEMVRWIERDDKRGVLLKYAPLHVGPFLAANLWAQHPAVLLSATLALGDDFSYIAERLGVTDYQAFDAGTPFDYPKQAAFYVPEGLDAGDRKPGGQEKWRVLAQVQTKKLVLAAGGRALLLFTSRKAMTESHDAIAAELEAEGITVLKQGDRPNKVLAEQFKSEETSVLFALRSFMTGVDVQGDALRLVVIDKLPFPVPTDVIFKARCDALDAVARNTWVDGAFPKLTVPTMALVLLQAFGRLIRTRNDRGVVAIMDSRLLTKPYGRKMMQAMPPAKRVERLDDAIEYLAALG